MSTLPAGPVVANQPIVAAGPVWWGRVRPSGILHVVHAAFYARALGAQPTGRGIVARRLAEHLPAVDPGLEVHLFAEAGIEVAGCTMHVARSGSSLGDAFRFLGGTAREIRRLRPDVVLCATHLVPPWLPREIPKVIVVHDLVWRDLPSTMSLARRVLRPLMDRSVRRASAIVCVSNFTRERLLSYWPDLESRVRVVHEAPGFDSRAAAPDANERERPVEPFVLSVDTIEPRKGLETLFEAMNGFGDLQLVQCGATGWRARRLLRQAREVANVRLEGYVDDARLEQLYRDARVAVLPSRYEGFHISALDALALGCPLVLSDIPVHREVVGEAGEYFAPGDVNALRSAIDRVARDESLRDSLRQRGRERVAEFSWESAARSFVDVLRDVVKA